MAQTRRRARKCAPENPSVEDLLTLISQELSLMRGELTARVDTEIRRSLADVRVQTAEFCREIASFRQEMDAEFASLSRSIQGVRGVVQDTSRLLRRADASLARTEVLVLVQRGERPRPPYQIHSTGVTGFGLRGL